MKSFVDLVENFFLLFQHKKKVTKENDENIYID